jgi:hypothetical protein
MLDQKMNFGLFLGSETEARRGGVQSGEASGDVILGGQSFADVMQEQGEDQQIAPVEGFPKRRVLRAAGVRGIGELLQVLDGAQRVFVNGVAVIKVADH